MFLLLKRELFNLVVSGKKTSTLRKSINFKIGDTIEFRQNTNKVEVKIKNIEKIKTEDINEKILENEGVSNIEELKNILFQCYNMIPKEMYYIEFEKIKNNNFLKELEDLANKNKKQDKQISLF